jgi:hypothetical protein
MATCVGFTREEGGFQRTKEGDKGLVHLDDRDGQLRPWTASARLARRLRPSASISLHAATCFAACRPAAHLELCLRSAQGRDLGLHHLGNLVVLAHSRSPVAQAWQREGKGGPVDDLRRFSGIAASRWPRMTCEGLATRSAAWQLTCHVAGGLAGAVVVEVRRRKVGLLGGRMEYQGRCGSPACTPSFRTVGRWVAGG